MSQKFMSALSVAVVGVSMTVTGQAVASGEPHPASTGGAAAPELSTTEPRMVARPICEWAAQPIDNSKTASLKK